MSFSQLLSVKLVFEKIFWTNEIVSSLFSTPPSLLPNTFFDVCFNQNGFLNKHYDNPFFPLDRNFINKIFHIIYCYHLEVLTFEVVIRFGNCSYEKFSGGSPKESKNWDLLCFMWKQV